MTEGSPCRSLSGAGRTLLRQHGEASLLCWWVGSARTWLCPEGRAASPGAGSGAEPAPGRARPEPPPRVPAPPVCPRVGFGEGTDQDRPRGAQQGQQGLVLVPVLGFLHSSICISLITLLFGHLGLIPVTVLGVHSLSRWFL